MSKQKILVFINSVLFIAFVITIISVFLYKIIPSKLNGNEIIGEFHEIAGLVFAIFVILHIAFNWKWIKTQMLKKRGDSK